MSTNPNAGAAKKKFKVPHTYVIIFSLIILTAILTWIIPAGVYDRVDIPRPDGGTRSVVDPNSFHYVDSNPSMPFDVLKAFPEGLVRAAQIVFFIFVVGGSFTMLTGTGAITAAINSLALKMRNNDRLMIPLFVIVFSIGGATIGMAEEAIVFVPIGIALARALGYDAITGMSMVTLGAAVGFTSAPLNPFTVGVAQTIAEVPMFSGMWLRLIIMVVTWVLVIWYISRYAKKVKNDPTKSFNYEAEQQLKGANEVDFSKMEKMTGRDTAVLLVFLAGMMLLVYGVIEFGWYIMEISALFFGIGIVAGLVGGSKPSQMAVQFLEGAKDIAVGALVAGLARGILVIMEDAQIIHTVVHGLAQFVVALPGAISAVGMFIVQSLINFAIPSGSGQAATTMPIMAPLADLAGLTRQTAVLAFQFGDGISNSIIPTSGTLMANLSIAKVKYEDWVKFVAPLMLIWSVLAAVFCVIAALVNYGPF